MDGLQIVSLASCLGGAAFFLVGVSGMGGGWIGFASFGVSLCRSGDVGWRRSGRGRVVGGLSGRSRRVERSRVAG